MTQKNYLIATLLLTFIPGPHQLGHTADAPYIQVGTAKTKKTIISLPDFKTPAGSLEVSKLARTIQDTVSGDLTYMDLFKFLPQSAYLEKPSEAGIQIGTFKMTDWTSNGTDFLIKAGLTVEGKNISLEAYLYQPLTNKTIIAKKYVALSTEAKILAHTFANDIVEALTGSRGIFKTRIVMSCDRTGKKEIYTMDFDGSNVLQMTQHRSIAFAPAWSPDGTKIAFSLYTKHSNNEKNIDLFEYNSKDKTIRQISSKPGINSGAAYSPDGKKLLLTLSHLGNPEIFELDLESKEVTNRTRSVGFDVDPAYSPDGKKVAFVSSRAGKPMIYSMGADGSSPTRLTFAGSYNATPSWSPNNQKIAFAGWIDGHFDIFIMNTDGTRIERLTKKEGNNEDPHYSPDGNFIVFSSNRTGTKNIYVMNSDGTFVKRLTYGLGNCVSPKWSN